MRILLYFCQYDIHYIFNSKSFEFQRMNSIFKSADKSLQCILEDHNGKFCDNSTEIFATCSGFGCKCNLTKIKSLLPIISLFYICWNWFFYFVNYNLLPFYDKAFYKSHQFSYYGHGYFLDVLFGLFWPFVYNNSSSKEYPEHNNLSAFNTFI